MQNRNSRLGFFAGLLLGLTCFAIGAYNTWQVQHLINNGVQAEAEVVGIKTGAKGAKIPLVRFTAPGGEQVTAKDMFQLIFVRHKKGDRVSVRFDPDNPGTVLIDSGIWIWQQPVLLFLGGFFLIFLVVFLAEKEKHARLK